MTTLNEYQEACAQFAEYPHLGHGLVYPALGLAGEAGEVCENTKKMMRDDHGVLSDARRSALKKELGDVLWYVARCAAEAGLTLEEVGQANIEKLSSRQRRGVLHGDGDDR